MDIRHPCPNNDHKNLISSFVDTSLETEGKSNLLTSLKAHLQGKSFLAKTFTITCRNSPPQLALTVLHDANTNRNYSICVMSPKVAKASSWAESRQRIANVFASKTLPV